MNYAGRIFECHIYIVTARTNDELLKIHTLIKFKERHGVIYILVLIITAL